VTLTASAPFAGPMICVLILFWIVCMESRRTLSKFPSLLAEEMLLPNTMSDEKVMSQIRVFLIIVIFIKMWFAVNVCFGDRSSSRARMG